VPFLDKEFIDVAMRINPEAKMSKDGRIEKHILRQAFEHKLPKEVVWRQKEQFSDGVGYSWIDGLKAHAAENVDDVQFANAKFRFPYNTPESKEAYFYRSFFEEFFPLASAAETVPGGKTVACSTPEALLWDVSLQGLNDPSGRAVKNVHASAY
jgi:asparagine synthase (glutamine-hydrolysing)